eukprot:6373382-Prymnesium_polylepis.1
MTAQFATLSIRFRSQQSAGLPTHRFVTREQATCTRRPSHQGRSSRVRVPARVRVLGDVPLVVRPKHLRAQA